MKKTSISLILLVALTLSLWSSVASAVLPPPVPTTITYTGDQYVPCCNPCLEATLVDQYGGPVVGAVINFGIVGEGIIGTAETDADGVATLCLEGCYPSGEYDIRVNYGGGGSGIDDYCTVYVYEARAIGGGQIVTDDETLGKKKDQYKISFEVAAYLVDGVPVLDYFEVTFHNVSEDALDKKIFVAENITLWECQEEGTKVHFIAVGEIEGECGVYTMNTRLRDLGEPSIDDNLRFEMTGPIPYDTHGGDFADASGQQSRTLLVNGNVQVECLECQIPD